MLIIEKIQNQKEINNMLDDQVTNMNNICDELLADQIAELNNQADELLSDQQNYIKRAFDRINDFNKMLDLLED